MKKLIISLLIMLSMMGCKKKQNEIPLTIWSSALQGTETLKDVNENNLPEITSLPDQTVATKGDVNVTTNLTAIDCYRDDLPISCQEEEIDYSMIEYQLVNSFGEIVQKGNFEKNGTIIFTKEIKNGNYRILTKDSNILNWTHEDFNYIFDPTKKNEFVFFLKAKKKYYNSGPAEIIGEVTSSGWRSLSGEILLTSQKIANVPVRLFCRNELVMETITDENGKYYFNTNLKNGNCYISAKGENISIYNSYYKNNQLPFRFVFNGFNPNMPTQVLLSKIVLDWQPKASSKLTVNAGIKNTLAFLADFKVELLASDGTLITKTATDDKGEFSISKELIRDTYSLRISKEGFSTVETSFLFEPSWNQSELNINLPKNILPIPMPKTIEIPKDLNVVLTPKSTYETLKELGSLLSDSWTTNNLSPVSLTNMNGKIQLPPGDWEITFTKIGYVPSQSYRISNMGEQITIPMINVAEMTPAISHRTVMVDLSLNGIKDTSGVMLYLKNILIDNQNIVISLIFKDGRIDYSTLKFFKSEGFCYENPNNCETMREVNVRDYGIEKIVTTYNSKLLLGEGIYNWQIYDPLKTFSGNGIFNIAKGNMWAEDIKLSIEINSTPKSNINGLLSNAFTLSKIEGVNIEIGQYENNIFSSLKAENNVIKDRTNSDQSLFDRPSAISNSNGVWAINGIPNGTYTLKYSKEGFETIYQTVTVPLQNQIVSNMISNIGRGNLSGSIVLPGGFIFNSRFTLELESPYSYRKPSSPIPSELASGSTTFSNTSTYKLYNIDSGLWKMSFRANGYETIVCWVNIGSGENNYDVLTAVAGGQPPHKISGVLYNAINNKAVTSSLTLTLRPGMNNVNGNMATKNDGSVYPILTSSIDGSFSLPDVPSGVYTLSVTGDNWNSTINTVVSADGVAPYQIFVSPRLASDEMRVVLSWASSPRDLDSHLEYGNSACRNTDGTRCQVLWNSKKKLDGDLTLDVDVTNGFGPETITIKGKTWTMPRRGYTIYNWSNENSLGSSEAIVKIFKNGTSRSFSVPKPFIGRWWNTFCLGSDMSIISIGENGCQNSDFWNVSY